MKKILGAKFTYDVKVMEFNGNIIHEDVIIYAQGHSHALEIIQDYCEQIKRDFESVIATFKGEEL